MPNTSTRQKRQTSPQCPVCCEKFTTQTRKPVDCANCEYTTCTACARAYLLTLTCDPKCMQCNHPWDREFLDATFPKAFVNGEHAKHREQVLLEREMAQLPDSQHLVQNYQTATQIKEALAADAREKQELHQRLAAIERRKWNLSNRMERIVRSNYQTDGLVGDDVTGESSERAQFICKCPAENCRGFLSTQYKCGTCNLYACQDCREVIGSSRDAPHVCDPETVQTIALLKKETKPCPSCGTQIFKIDGCDQMWCTSCRTPFSWKTGLLIRGTIHNPHFFEYMRAHGSLQRQPGDMPCGGDITYREMDRVLHQCKNDVPEMSIKRDVLFGILRFITHVHEVTLHTLRAPPDDINADLRRRYLMNEVSLNEWKRTLQLRERKRERHQAFRQVYELLYDAGSESLRSLRQRGTAKDVERVYDELRALYEYVGPALDRIANRFACKVPEKVEAFQVQEDKARAMAELRNSPKRPRFV